MSWTAFASTADIFPKRWHFLLWNRKDEVLVNAFFREWMEEGPRPWLSYDSVGNRVHGCGRCGQFYLQTKFHHTFPCKPYSFSPKSTSSFVYNERKLSRQPRYRSRKMTEGMKRELAHSPGHVSLQDWRPSSSCPAFVQSRLSPTLFLPMEWALQST